MRPELSEDTVERVNRIAENKEVSSPVESLSYEDRLELVLDEYQELRREVEELREEVERLRREKDGDDGEGVRGRREELEKLRKEQTDPTRGNDTFEF
jgi:predicted RNase H-like nuclease (RuvC/YqgF family)